MGDRYADEAVATLREAIAAGWKEFAHMHKDPDHTVLRDREEFKRLLEELKAKGNDRDPARTPKDDTR